VETTGVFYKGVTMNLVKISGSFRSTDGLLSVNVHTAPDCKETKCSYVREGERIAKSKINVIQTITYNHTLDYVNFYVLSLDDKTKIEENKKQLKEYMIKIMGGMIERNKTLNTIAEKAINLQEWKEKESRYDD
jgi:hypothetical protein